jgi:hypothetical protein
VQRQHHRDVSMINGPRFSAAIKSASVAACHSGLCCFDFGRANAAASLSVTSGLSFGSRIGSSNCRDAAPVATSTGVAAECRGLKIEGVRPGTRVLSLLN